MSTRRFVLVGATVMIVAMFSSGSFGQARDPIAGPWEQISAKNLTTGEMQQLPSPPLHVIYSNGHYVQFTAAAGRPKTQTPPADLTKEQLLERFRMQGQYGTYRIEGNRLIRKIVSAANPNNEGIEGVSDFRVEADTLITVGTPQGVKTETRFRRLK